MGELLTLILNLLLYILLFVFTWKKNKHFGPAEILILMYILVAFFGVVYYKSNPSMWNLDFLNLLYLFFIFYIFQVPISNNRYIVVNDLPVRNVKFYSFVAIVFICFSLFSCIVYIPQVILALKSPDWSEIYNEAHEETESNLLLKLANLFFHLRYLGIVLFFYFLSLANKSKFFLLLLGISSFLPIVLLTIKAASRGALVSLAISLFLTFKLFEYVIPRSIKRVLFRIVLISIPIMLTYLISVSNSRFEYGKTSYDSAESSYVAYLGQSMLNFDNGLMSSITAYSDGGYLLNIESRLNRIRGANFGAGFITFIGCLYLDFGPMGTFLIALIFTLWLKNIVRRKYHGIPELFLITTYFMFLFDGVFVVGRGYGQQWIETLFIYSVLKIMRK